MNVKEEVLLRIEMMQNRVAGFGADLAALRSIIESSVEAPPEAPAAPPCEHAYGGAGEGICHKCGHTCLHTSTIPAAVSGSPHRRVCRSCAVILGDLGDLSVPDSMPKEE